MKRNKVLQKFFGEEIINKHCIQNTTRQSVLGKDTEKNKVVSNMYALYFDCEIQSIVVLIKEKAIVKWDGSKKGKTSLLV